ncbi:hypothetical protein [Nocardioides nitrophenolicus]|uniref:hypothetical protein n=1 Tax=Nocardioides nitrophenolicus TaxID=60489 RepID=UPI0019589629|nr:hypothetical protein [Nocardioides nitrophenolicus]MBM7520301.1 regulator of protease activity HflC (stomatin/prohibitin superfamily) [Nocardioides nitrophenolicus]
MADPTDDAAPHPGDPAAAERPSWPAFIPHREIDGLLERIENAAAVEPAEAARLLRMISKEAQRLRAMALRMTTEKLAEADREASGILSEALSHADTMRSVGLATLNSRLDEADQLMATVREAFRLELRATDLRDA